MVICARDYITTWKAIYTWYISGIYCHLRWWYANYIPPKPQEPAKIEKKSSCSWRLKALWKDLALLKASCRDDGLRSISSLPCPSVLAIGWLSDLSVCGWKNGEKNGNMSKKRWMKHLNVLLKKKHSEECGWMKCWSHAWKRYLNRLAFIETFGEFRKKTFHLFWWTFVRGARDFDISIYDADPRNELQGPVACASEHFFVWLYEDHEDQWARVSLQIAMCALVFFGAQDVSHLLTCVTPDCFADQTII